MIRTEYPELVENDADTRYNKAVADVLRERKEAIGITFDDLALAAELPRATIARIIYGHRDIKVYALRRIAGVLELDPGEVLKRAETAL